MAPRARGRGGGGGRGGGRAGGRGGGVGNTALMAGGLAALTLPGMFGGAGGGGVFGGLGGALGQLGGALAWVLAHPQEAAIGVVGTIIVFKFL